MRIAQGAASRLRQRERRLTARARLLVHVISHLGLPMVALVLVNSLRREVTLWREKSGRGGPRDGVTPGSVERVDPVSGGAQFAFSRLRLEARYVADDVLLLSWGPGLAPVPYATAGERSVSPAPSVLALDRGTGGWDLISEALVLHVGVDGGTEVRCRDGTVLRRAAPPVRRGGSWEQDLGMRPGERFSGLGEQSSRVDLRGGKFDLWNRDVGGAWGPGAGPLYFGVPAVLATHPDGDVLTFYENSTRAVFSFGDSAAPRDQEGRASVVFAGGRLRSYVIAGSVPHLLDRYSELTGRPSLPPRWALGHHQSRWGYRSATEVRGVLDGYALEKLPLSAVHLDIDYMDGYRVFTVDRSRFGDISELASDAEQSGTRLVTILDPGVKVDPRYDLYRQGQVLGTFCRDTHGNPVRGVVWPGRVVFPDFTDPRARAWWAGHYRVLTDAGVGGCWHDMNEPASISIVGDPTLPLDVRHDLDGRGGDHAEAHNLYGLLMNRAGYEGLALARPDRRPFILSRSGWAGNQRWAWTWTGDTESSWSSMRQQVATVIGLGLSGIPFAGSDIGGFSGVPDDDLYLRWLQMSVFTGLCRTHSVVGAPLREPWRFAGLTRRRIGAWIRFRYRLLPYLYTLAHEAAVSGAPLVRPLWWPPPGDIDDILSTELARRGLGDQDDSFMLGDALLVAPVVEPGARMRRVVLPPGSWRHLWDCDEIVPGAGAGHDRGAHEGAGPSGPDGPRGVAVEVSAPADRLPVLVRSGTILPLDDGFADPSGPCRLEGDPAASVPAGQLGMDHAPRLLSFHCWPSSRGTARGLCTDDAGDGFGPVRRDELRLEGGVPGSTAVLTWLRSGEFPPPSRVRVVIHGGDSARVVADGHDIGGTVCGSIECVPFHRLELRDLTPAGRSVPPGARR